MIKPNAITLLSCALNCSKTPNQLPLINSRNRLAQTNKICQLIKSLREWNQNAWFGIRLFGWIHNNKSVGEINTVCFKLYAVNWDLLVHLCRVESQIETIYAKKPWYYGVQWQFIPKFWNIIWMHTQLCTTLIGDEKSSLNINNNQIHSFCVLIPQICE